MLALIIVCFLQNNITSVSDSLTGKNNRLSLIREDQVVLQENLEIFGHINDLAVREDFFITVTDNPAALIRHNLDGSQNTIISRSGQGPFEYLTPRLVDVDEDYIIVWDANNLKLLFFNSDGTGKTEFIGDIRQAIRTFIYKNEYIYIYRGGSARGNLVEIYEVGGDGLTLSKEYGERNEYHNMISRYSGTHPLAYHNQKLYYGVANKAELVEIDLISGDEKVLSLEVPGFIVNPRLPDVRNNRERRSYLFSNSRFKNIYITDKFLICEFQHGSINARTRNTELVFYDYEFNFIDSIILDYSYMQRYGDGLMRVYGNRLYFLNNFSGFVDTSNSSFVEEDYQRKISIWHISEN